MRGELEAGLDLMVDGLECGEHVWKVGACLVGGVEAAEVEGVEVVGQDDKEAGASEGVFAEVIEGVGGRVGGLGEEARAAVDEEEDRRANGSAGLIDIDGDGGAAVAELDGGVGEGADGAGQGVEW